MNSSEEPAGSPPQSASSQQDDRLAGDLATGGDPGISSVFDYLRFGASLPERALRSSSAMLGGALRESASLLVPQAFRSSRSYSMFVQQMLDFMAEDIGGVQRAESEQDTKPQVENYVARKTVGSFIDLAGMATLHLSPLTLMALFSDAAYGSQVYLKELSEELKRQGVIDEQSTIDSAADLLNAVSNASRVTSQAFDTPPFSVKGLKETIDQTREAVQGIDPATVIPQAEVKRMWDEMHKIAREEGVSVLEVSSAMTMFTLNKVNATGRGALSTVTVAGGLFKSHIFDHYSSGLKDIQDKGLYASLAQSSKPYVEAVWQNFSSDKSTITEDLLTGRMIGRAWSGMRGWFGRREE